MSVDTAAPRSGLSATALSAVIALSVAISIALIWLIYYKGRVAEPAWVLNLPFANAIFNSLSALCLLLGYRNIRRGRRVVHMRFMLAATAFSTLFLTSYVVYHSFHGNTIFPGRGWIRPVYFFILVTHIVLSMAALPFILLTLWLALSANFPIHRRVARITFPIWLYVSVTGVLVFAILRAYTG